eukprot:gene57-biopygen4311
MGKPVESLRDPLGIPGAKILEDTSELMHLALCVFKFKRGGARQETPSGDHPAPPQLNDPSEEGRLSDGLASLVGQRDQGICPSSFRLVHSGVEGKWRPDTRAEHTGNATAFAQQNSRCALAWAPSARRRSWTAAWGPLGTEGLPKAMSCFLWRAASRCRIAYVSGGRAAERGEEMSRSGCGAAEIPPATSRTAVTSGDAPASPPQPGRRRWGRLLARCPRRGGPRRNFPATGGNFPSGEVAAMARGCQTRPRAARADWPVRALDLKMAAKRRRGTHGAGGASAGSRVPVGPKRLRYIPQVGRAEAGPEGEQLANWILNAALFVEVSSLIPPRGGHADQWELAVRGDRRPLLRSQELYGVPPPTDGVGRPLRAYIAGDRRRRRLPRGADERVGVRAAEARDVQRE